MIACYAPQATFVDSIFMLSGKAVGAMWHMLCSSGQDLAINFRDISADDRHGAAHWEARYTFSATGRHVHNMVDAEFDFRDGLIVRHHDRFGFWRWSRMALGPAGWLLGWTPLLHRRVQRSAQDRLARFIAAHPEYQELQHSD
jgi:hypothetical protein